MTNNHPEWQVILIGGSSGTGKTVVGQELARRLGVSLVLVDDIRLAIQAVTTCEHNPTIYTFIAEGSTVMRSPAAVRDGLIAVAKAMEPALRIIMAHHLAVAGAGAIVIEGDGILPQLVSPQYLSGLDELRGVPTERTIRPAFLHEADKDALFQNMLNRGRGFQDMSAEEQRAFSEGSWLFGQYIARQAQANKLPLLPARPFDTLAERIGTALEVGG
jgi:2-phosphoglycerate kinase